MAFNFYFWIEVITLLICGLCYNKFTLTRYKLFLPYLLIIVLYELGNIHKMFTIDNSKSNLWISNFELLFEYVFYSGFIIAVYKDKKQKRIITLVSVLCVIFTLVDIFFIQGFMALSTIAILIQYSILIPLVCRFFYMKMQEHDTGQEESLLQQPDFWVHTGLLFFFLAEFLFFASYTNMAYKKLYSFHLLFSVISNVAIFILYSCLSISFVCFRRMKKISY